jgi:hypothetical protein
MVGQAGQGHDRFRGVYQAGQGDPGTVYPSLSSPSISFALLNVIEDENINKLIMQLCTRDRKALKT